MDFIERWLGISPDGGNGSLEIALVILALLVLIAPFLARKIRSMHAESSNQSRR